MDGTACVWRCWLGLQQEGDNDPVFLGVVLGLAAGRGYEGHGGRAWNEWEDIWFSYRIYSHIITFTVHDSLDKENLNKVDLSHHLSKLYLLAEV